MLIQISDFEGGNWIVDPLKIRVEPLGRALRDSTIVMHGGREDLRILYRELGCTPAKYFDVQVAVGMLGYDYPLRYSSLIQEVLGTNLHQKSTLSDWSKRPLTEEQCEYALDDVRFFPEIFEIHTDKNSKISNGAEDFHSDVSCDIKPPLGTMLQLHILPESGGDTMFANMYMAYDALSNKHGLLFVA